MADAPNEKGVGVAIAIKMRMVNFMCLWLRICLRQYSQKEKISSLRDRNAFSVVEIRPFGILRAGTVLTANEPTIIRSAKFRRSPTIAFYYIY